MKTVVLQSNYIPWRGYFDLIHEADQFIFYDEVQYTKNDWRNRNKIVNANGPFWLSIPIAKEAVKLKISEVQLPNTDWRNEHIEKIIQSYQKAPYIKQVLELMESGFKAETLSKLNQSIIISISEKAGFKTEFKHACDFKLMDGRIERLIDLLVQSGASTYISGPSAMGYLKGSENLFEEAGIGLKFKNYAMYPSYTQPCKEFFAGASIIDCIAQVGFSNLALYLQNKQ